MLLTPLYFPLFPFEKLKVYDDLVAEVAKLVGTGGTGKAGYKLLKCACESDGVTPVKCCSGLSNVGDKTPVMYVSAGARKVPIYGDGQRTGTLICPNGVNKHAQTSINIATTAAATGDYEYLTLNRAWSSSTGASTDTRRPDVIGVRCDGKVDAWEAISATDDPKVLRARVTDGLASLPVANRGTIDVIPLAC